MRALTLWQPWATLVAVGAKKIETRGWPTKHRGLIAIHASQSREGVDLVYREAVPAIIEALNSAGYQHGLKDLPRGAIVAVADLVDCRRITATNAPPEPEFFFGDYTPGRWAWILANVRRLPEPVPCRGAQQLWTVPGDVARQVEEVIR